MTTQHIGGCVPRSDRAISTPVQRLLDRVRNDRYAEDQVSHGGDPVIEPIKRREFNAGSRHVESLIHQWINEATLELSLAELAEAPAMDLRLKHALVSDQQKANGPNGKEI